MPHVNPAKDFEQAMHFGKVLRERGESIDAPGSAAYDDQQPKAELSEGADLEPEQRHLPSLYEFDHQQVIARYALALSLLKR